MSAVVPGGFFFYSFLPLFTTTTRSFLGYCRRIRWFWFFLAFVHFLVLLFSYAKLTVSLIIGRERKGEVCGDMEGGSESRQTSK